MAGEIGLGLSFDLNALNAQFKQADKRLEVFAESAEKQMKRVNDAFSLSATKGLAQLSKELENVYSKLGVLSKKNKLELKPALNDSATAKVIDDVNKIINYTRKEWEELNRIKIGAKLIDPKMINDIEALSTRLTTLQSALSSGKIQQGNISQKLTDSMRVSYADEIKAIEDRLKVLRMSTSEFNKLKAQEAANIIKNAQIAEDALKAEKKRLQDELDAKKKAAEELAKIQSQRRSSMYSRVQSTGIYYDKSGKAQDASKQAEAAFNRLYSNKGIMSVQKMNEVLNKLQAAQQKLNLRTDEGKKRYDELGKKIKQVKQDLDKATGASEKLNQTQQRLGDISKKLANKAAALFSVQAITGYIKKVIEVRGEFEMQHRAMQTLIGDIDKAEANRLWDKTVSLAVKSPFRVRELITYTKQLSAYRIETDKLYDKTKMLADISAGLGVDMNRLILAYGQVKAANYLRGTELRQFSEAGINVLKELSDYFTELEGRAVSVGDIFERVSKRMVTFADVDAVLTKVTSEGGTFYQMQEKQSETLKGLMMNLSDSIDIMMNDLGKRNDNILKVTVGLLKDIIDNWRLIEPAIVAVGTALMVYFPLKKLGQIASAVKNIFTTVPKHPYALAIAGAAALAAGIYKVVTAQSKLNAELAEVDKSVSDELVDKLALYKKIARTIDDAATSTEEYEKAQKKLSSVFDSILPDHMLEAKYVKELGDNYKDVEDAMMSYYNAKAVEQKKEKVRQKYTEDIETNTSDLIIDMNQAINRSRVISEQEKIMLLSGVSGAVNETISAIERGEIRPEDITNAIYERLEQYSNVDFTNVIATESSMFNAIQMGANVKKLKTLLGEMNSAIEGVDGLPYETYEQKLLAKKIEEETNLMDSATNGFKDAVRIYTNAIKELSKGNADATKVWDDTNKKIGETLNAIADSEYKNKLEEVFKSLGENAKKGSFEFTAALQTLEQNLIAGEGGFNEIILSRFNTEEIGTDAAKNLLTNLQEELTKKGKNLNLSAFQSAVIAGAKGISEKFGVELDLFSQFIPNSEEALSTVTQELKSFIEDIETRVEKFKESSKVEGYGVLAPDVLSENTDKLKELEDALPALKEFAKLLGIIFKEPKKGGSDNLTDEQIRVIDNMNKKYRELKKTLTEGESIEGAFTAYRDAFEKAYKGTKFLEGKDMKTMTAEQFAEEVLNFPNRNDIVRFLDELAKLPKELDDRVRIELAKGAHVEEMNVEIRKDEQDKLLEQIEDMFGNYEVSLELDKMNIPPDLAKRIFGIDSMNLTELRNAVLKIDTSKFGTEALDEYDKFLKKLDKMEEDAQMERLKKYTKYLTEQQNESIKIKIKELRELSEVEELYKAGKYTKEEYSVITGNIKRDAQAAQAKETWESFAKSPDIVSLFDDLDKASNKSLQSLNDQLSKLKNSLFAAGLPASELKEILDKINQVEEELEERNPFKGLKEDLGTILSGDLDLYAKKRAYESAREKLAKEEDALEKAQSMYGLMASKYGVNDEGVKAYAYAVEVATRKVEAQKVIVGNLQYEWENAQEAVLGVGEHLLQINDYTQQLASSFSEMADKLGIMNESEQEGLNHAMATLEDVVNIGYSIAQIAANPGNPAAWVQGISSVMSLIGNIAATGDAIRQKEVDKQIKYASQMQKIYEQLAEDIENAYVFSDKASITADAKAQIQAQINALEEANSKAEKMKKKDKEGIESREDEIRELEKKKAELDRELKEDLGMEYDLGAAAERFVDAWASAFQETGDGITGLDEEFDSFFDNLVRKSITSKAITKILEPLHKKLNESLTGDYTITDAELANLKAISETAKGQMNAVLKNAEDLYGAFSGIEEGTLCGLQAGIQGITEDQADILAAYWNQVRFDVTTIKQWLTDYDSSVISQPIVNSLNSVLEQVTMMQGIMSSVSNPESGTAFSVRLV